MIESLYRRLAVPVITRLIHPVIVHYIDNYTDPVESEAGSGKAGYDPRSTIASDTAVAANRDHDVMEVLGFGFTSSRRASEDRAKPGAY